MVKKPPFSPMMMKYLEVKEQYKDTLLLYRLGDFYELFFEDAKIASRELELVLTGKDAGAEERVPMCGMPHHAVKGYIEKLIKKGYKVAIAEQLEDPSTAKGLVKRGVVQVITPGTMIDTGLEEKRNNYIAAIEDFTTFFVISYADLSTGEVGVLNIEHDENSLTNELEALECKEVIVDPSFKLSYLDLMKAKHNITVSFQEESEITLEYESLLVNTNDIRQEKAIVRLVDYLTRTQMRSLDYLQPAKVIKTKQYLQMDAFTRFNLELTRTIRSDDRFGNLLWILDKTKTAMGGRLLQRYIVRPLADKSEIERRLDNVEALANNYLERMEIINGLKEVYDLPRLIGRIGYGNANAKDLIQLSKSLKVVPSIKSAIYKIGTPSLSLLADQMPDLSAINELIEASIVENPPFTIKEGGMIKQGYNTDLDELNSLSKGGKDWISRLEAVERERTGIKGLKIGFNKVFGFYIEITNSYLPLVKDEFGYIRKQTLTNGERFITQELKEKEALVLGAEDKAIKLEYEIFVSIREEIKKYTEQIQKLADHLSVVDVLTSFAEVSIANDFVRPLFNDEHKIQICEGRHPVIEKVIGHNAYVPNNTYLDETKNLLLITGPNMGGKSTYMRQVTLICIMAQIGCFVPAKSANLSVVDQIFTRIGASDDLVSGQSTFMVEMSEANNALKNATANSLIIFDEIGRGTSTYDGMALAQAIIEYIALNIKAFTLFSTHYHELTALEGKLPGLYNISVGIHEENEKVTFLYKIIEGAANKSYGINVARLAHLPEDLLSRANQILETLEQNKATTGIVEYKIAPKKQEEPEYVKQIKNLDPLAMTPMEALNFLYELQKKLK